MLPHPIIKGFIVGHKSRTNFKIGKCLDTCECRSCRKDKTPKNFKTPTTKTIGSSKSFGLVINTYYANDGSVMEKPMSQTYINHIRSRNSDTIKKMKPNMGCYGA